MNNAENNKLIAYFMDEQYDNGYIIKQQKSHVCRLNPTGQIHIPVKYDKSWDWLMPVVEKIEIMSINGVLPDFFIMYDKREENI